MMLMRKIPISWARRQAARAVAGGVSLEDLFHRAMITNNLGNDRDRITPLQLTLLQALLVLETNDANHAMFQHRVDPEIGPLAFRILFGSANLHDGLLSLSRFYEKTNQTIGLALSVSGQRATLFIRAANDHDEGLLQEDIQLTYLYFGLTRFLGRPFPVSFVTTRDQTHPNHGSTHYAMGSPLVLGSCAGLHFSKSLLLSKPPSATLGDFLWHPVRDALRLMEMRDTELGAATSNRTFLLHEFAAEREVAPSTFRRQLAREGASFRQMRERAILSAAVDLLSRRSHSIEAIAAELGYSDARSLRRFVKRATGRTPDQLRSELHVVPPARLHAQLKEAFSQLSKRAHPRLF